MRNATLDRTNVVMLIPLLYIIYINDLPLYINKLAKVFLFADDTSILDMGNNHAKLEQKIMATLPLMVEWVSANKLALNISKTFLDLL
jgi:hypothetical protein